MGWGHHGCATRECTRLSGSRAHLSAREQLLFEINRVGVQAAHAHGLEELHARLDQAAVNDGTVALLLALVVRCVHQR